jgi:hypothetical protein
MPSPFPGMDPYLEGSLWTTLHFALGAEIVRQLAPKLRPRYLVLPVERFVIEMPETVAVTAPSVYPDAGIWRTREQTHAHVGVAVMDAPLELRNISPSDSISC